MLIATTALAALTLAAACPPQGKTPPDEAARQTPTPPPESAPAKPASATIERIDLGHGRRVDGVIVKETDGFVFVDLGFDILRVPQPAIVARQTLQEEKTGASNVRREDVFAMADLPELSIAAGSRKVGEGVVKVDTPSGQGSGFLTSADGWIVTNFHVVEDELDADITLYLQRENGFELRTVRNAKVYATNPELDLALIKMEPPRGVELTPVFLGRTESVEVGQRVYAIGTPLGLERTVSSGIVSVTNRVLDGYTHFQITVPINPGNSGGPLFNLRGEVVGVNCAGYVGLQGLNFAIPSKFVIDFLRNRDAFVVDPSNTENGIRYLPAPRRPRDPNRTPGRDK